MAGEAFDVGRTDGHDFVENARGAAVNPEQQNSAWFSGTVCDIGVYIRERSIVLALELRESCVKTLVEMFQFILHKERNTVLMELHRYVSEQHPTCQLRSLTAIRQWNPHLIHGIPSLLSSTAMPGRDGLLACSSDCCTQQDGDT